jgi:hypothetical protein
MPNLMYNTPVIEKEINDGVHWVLIEYDQKHIGFMACTHFADKQTVKPNKLYLKTYFRGKGIG